MDTGTKPAAGGMKPATRPTAPEVLASWQEYRASGDRRVRDRLIFMLMPMVRYIVHRKVRAVPAHCDVEDFLSCGLEALIGAIERFDPERGATLEQYAWTRVQGAVLDELRRQDWAPRSLRRDERAIGDARESFAAEHDRRPTPQELATRLGVSTIALRKRLDEIALADVGSLNRSVRGDEGAAIEQIDTLESADRDSDPLSSAARREAKERFRKAFARLSRQEREVAVMLYVEGLTLRRIGERLGVSESRISQIHTRMRRRLYEQLAGELALFSELV